MKTLASLVIAVVLITICAPGLGFAQDNGPDTGRQPGRGMRGIMEHRKDMVQKLKLTDQQKDKISELKTSFRKSMVDLRADLQKNRIDLKALKTKENINRDDVISAVEKVNKSRDAIALAVTNHLLDVYQVLTPEQQKIWKENAHSMRMGRRGNMGLDGDRF